MQAHVIGGKKRLSLRRKQKKFCFNSMTINCGISYLHCEFKNTMVRSSHIPEEMNSMKQAMTLKTLHPDRFRSCSNSFQYTTQ